MSEDRTRLASRLFDLAITVLLAAMALWGAIAILQSIWRPLCLVAATVGALLVAGWVVHTRFRRW